MQLRRLTLLAMLFVVVIPGASHGQLGRILARSAERRIARSASRSFLNTLRRDLVRDAQRTTRPRARRPHALTDEAQACGTHAGPCHRDRSEAVNLLNL